MSCYEFCLCRRCLHFCKCVWHDVFNSSLATCIGSVDLSFPARSTQHPSRSPHPPLRFEMHAAIHRQADPRDQPAIGRTEESHCLAELSRLHRAHGRETCSDVRYELVLLDAARLCQPAPCIRLSHSGDDDVTVDTPRRLGEGVDCLPFTLVTTLTNDCCLSLRQCRQFSTL